MDQPHHTPVRIRRLTGKNPGDHLFCEICGVKWPCLKAADAAMQAAQRPREIARNVTQEGGSQAAVQGYTGGTAPV